MTFIRPFPELNRSFATCNPFLLLVIFVLVFNSVVSGQNNSKVAKLEFCGYRYNDSATIRKHISPQLAFLKIQSDDTVVDVGSSSGAYVGLFATIANFQNVHFVLVDIDSLCLNEKKVNNMQHHYARLRGSELPCSFSYVVNTPDSLNLPVNRYKKVLFLNTLHEIENRESIARQLVSILAPGGELIISEIIPTAKRKKHGGCRWPLISEQEIADLFTPLGFVIVDKANLQVNPTKLEKTPYLFFRLKKSGN